jgi:hypothetical protein
MKCVKTDKLAPISARTSLCIVVYEIRSMFITFWEMLQNWRCPGLLVEWLTRLTFLEGWVRGFNPGQGTYKEGLSDATKNRGPLYLSVYVRASKRSHTGGQQDYHAVYMIYIMFLETTHWCSKIDVDFCFQGKNNRLLLTFQTFQNIMVWPFCQTSFGQTSHDKEHILELYY